MKAIVLAAGRGERMRPLTDVQPKPLLRAGGRSLIERQIVRLVQAGFTDLVVNVSYLGERIEAELGNGASLGAHIEYSREAVALETAGGIAWALSKLGDMPFLAVNADVYCEYDFARLGPVLSALANPRYACDAHLVLVPNPAHHPQGDFRLAPDGILSTTAGSRLTFCGIGAYRPRFFAGIVPGERHALGTLLHEMLRTGALCGELYAGPWMDVGTPERLRQLDEILLHQHAP